MHLLCQWDRYTSSTRLFHDYRTALAALAADVRASWSDIAHRSEVPATPDGLSDVEVVLAFYGGGGAGGPDAPTCGEFVTNTGFEIVEEHVAGPEPNAVLLRLATLRVVDVDPAPQARSAASDVPAVTYFLVAAGISVAVPLGPDGYPAARITFRGPPGRPAPLRPPRPRPAWLIPADRPQSALGSYMPVSRISRPEFSTSCERTAMTSTVLDPSHFSDGPARQRLHEARTSRRTAQEHLYRAAMLEVAFLVREALPQATHLQVRRWEGSFVLEQVLDVDSVCLWSWWMQADPLARFRPRRGGTWSDVVAEVTCLLDEALGGEVPSTWWIPEEGGRNRIFRCPLPATAGAQILHPRHLTACLAAPGDPSGAALRFSQPVEQLTMSVAGVAITASIGEDGVLELNVDPTGTDPVLMRPAGAGTPVRVSLANTASSRAPRAPGARGARDPDPCLGGRS